VVLHEYPGARQGNGGLRPLVDNIAQLSNERPEVGEVYRDIIRMSTENDPRIDYHVHLKGGLTIERALANSRRSGINYGIAISCGLGFSPGTTTRAYASISKAWKSGRVT
jgi:hypothetical protein